MTEQNLKVGDKLAFAIPYHSGAYQLIKIDKITPSGRIICGKFTLNPDLSVRGAAGWSGVDCAYIPTDKHRHGAAMYELKARLHVQDWQKLSTDQMRRILQILDEPK